MFAKSKELVTVTQWHFIIGNAFFLQPFKIARIHKTAGKFCIPTSYKICFCKFLNLIHKKNMCIFPSLPLPQTKFKDFLVSFRIFTPQLNLQSIWSKTQSLQMDLKMICWCIFAILYQTLLPTNFSFPQIELHSHCVESKEDKSGI